MLLRLSFFVVAVLLLLALVSAIGSWWIERRYPPAGHFVEVDGIKLHYLMQGTADGPALVLIHGASSNLRDFASSILPSLARNHRVIAFDRPGYGYSERPEGEWLDPSRLAELLLDAGEKLGVQKPVLLGHSWGGSVVMSALVNFPERVSGGVLLGGVAGHWVGSVGWTYDLGRLPILGPLFARTLVLPAGSLMLDGAVKPVLAPSPVPESYVQDIAAPLAIRPKNFLFNVQDMTRLSRYMQSLSPRYDRIEKPLSFIHGSDDSMVPFWNHGRRVRPIVRHALAHRVEGAGHAPHHSHRDEVVSAIETFMSTISTTVESESRAIPE